MRHFLRLLAIAGVLSLVVAGLAACGGDDDEPRESGAATSQTDTQAETTGEKRGDKKSGGKQDDAPKRDSGPASSPTLSGDPEEAREGVAAVDEVYDSLAEAADSGVAAIDVPAGDTLEAADDVESLTQVCDLFSEEAKRQTIVFAKRSAGLADVDWTCEKAVGLLLRRARQSGGLKRSLETEIVGVNVKGDRATASVRFGGKGRISTVTLVKEDGEWKLGASPSGGGGGK